MRLIISAMLCAALLLPGSAFPADLMPTRTNASAPDFNLTDLDGVSHRLSDYRGKVVIVTFWATWCGPCRDELPVLQRAWKRLQREGVQVLAINVSQTAYQIQRALNDSPVTFPVLMDEGSAVTQEWEITMLPAAYVLDPQGRLSKRVIGKPDWGNPALLDELVALDMQR
jgi:peroxiredoxin